MGEDFGKFCGKPKFFVIGDELAPLPCHFWIDGAIETIVDLAKIEEPGEKFQFVDLSLLKV